MNKVAIAFICDDNYVVPTVVAITSLIENKRKVTYYDIFIIASELTEEHIQLFDRFNGDRVKVTVIWLLQGNMILCTRTLVVFI